MKYSGSISRWPHACVTQVYGCKQSMETLMGVHALTSWHSPAAATPASGEPTVPMSTAASMVLHLPCRQSAYAWCRGWQHTSYAYFVKAMFSHAAHDSCYRISFAMLQYRACAGQQVAHRVSADRYV